MSRLVQLVREDESFTVAIHGAEFTLRRMHPDTFEEIEAKYRRKRRNKRTQRDEWEVPQEDRLEQLKDVWAYMVRAWKGVGVGEEELPCTREHIWALPGSVKDEILAACDEANITGLRGDGATPDPTRRSAGSSTGS